VFARSIAAGAAWTMTVLRRRSETTLIFLVFWIGLRMTNCSTTDISRWRLGPGKDPAIVWPHPGLPRFEHKGAQHFFLSILSVEQGDNRLDGFVIGFAGQDDKRVRAVICGYLDEFLAGRLPAIFV